MPDIHDSLSFLALIPGYDADVAAARALMDYVSQQAHARGAGAHGSNTVGTDAHGVDTHDADVPAAKSRPPSTLALIAGPATVRAAALANAQAAGLDHAWFIPAPSAAAQTQTQQYVDLFASALQSDALAGLLPTALMLVSAQADNEAFAGALAARLDATPLGRCTELVFDAQGALHATRGAYGNRLLVTLESGGAAIAAIRPRAGLPVQAGASTSTSMSASASAAILAPATTTGASTAATPRLTVTQVHVLDDLPPPRASVAITPVPRNETHANLDGARIVVAGGRGMGNDDQAFPMLYDIADKLGGAVGASLPAVDAGWAPVTRQVGISGKYVSPDTYLAIGISGTPQHLAGIDPHTRIVAVNKDPEANIFNVAQAGAVAEWQALLPALLRALEEAEDS